MQHSAASTLLPPTPLHEDVSGGPGAPLLLTLIVIPTSGELDVHGSSPARAMKKPTRDPAMTAAVSDAICGLVMTAVSSRPRPSGLVAMQVRPEAG